MNKPIVGISMGDPFGNGPEITVKVFANEEIYGMCRPIVVGDAAALSYAAKVAEAVSGIHVEVHPIKTVSEAQFKRGVIDVISMGIVSEKDFETGKGFASLSALVQPHWAVKRHTAM